MTMHGDLAIAGIQWSDLATITERVVVLSVVVTFLGIGLLKLLAAKSVGLMLALVVGVSVICSLLGVGVIACRIRCHRDVYDGRRNAGCYLLNGIVQRHERGDAIVVNRGGRETCRMNSVVIKEERRSPHDCSAEHYWCSVLLRLCD